MNDEKLPFTCPICGQATEYAPEDLAEGVELTCPFCELKLTLHGHMWEEVQRELQKFHKNDGPR